LRFLTSSTFLVNNNIVYSKSNNNSDEEGDDNDDDNDDHNAPEAIMDDLELIDEAKKGNSDAIAEIKEKYPSFFDKESGNKTEEEALAQIEQELEDQFYPELIQSEREADELDGRVNTGSQGRNGNGSNENSGNGSNENPGGGDTNANGSNENPDNNQSSSNRSLVGFLLGGLG
jgi:hypothetical protein